MTIMEIKELQENHKKYENRMNPYKNYENDENLKNPFEKTENHDNFKKLPREK